MTNFVWFVITLIVTLSNILLSVFIYYELQLLRSKNKRVKELKEVCMYYATGMMIALILTLALFSLTFPV
ncbi:MAG: hypothetical protein HY514_04840 [Candidatus Aenigmarchaeota archaeon]|nr:hypothetical protein [Candidatus Aenigmarchaeota archaeon]